MAQSTPAQRRYLEALTQNLTEEQFMDQVRATGSASDRIASPHLFTTKNQRLALLTKAQASAMITNLKNA